MKKRNPVIVFIVITLFVSVFLAVSSVAQQHYVIPPTVKRILFLGNSITYAGQYVTDVEAYLVGRFPSRNLEIINMGLPSETVSGLSEDGHAGGRFPRPDLHERLQRILSQVKPDLVIASYGMNDGIYLPLDDERFQKFKDGIFWLHNQVVKTGAIIIHLTPPIYDEQTGGDIGYSKVLDSYSFWLLNLRQSDNWLIADMHFSMQLALEKRRKKRPQFSFAKDGIHPSEEGHWVMAQQLLKFLNEKEALNYNSINEAMQAFSNGEEIYELVKQRQSITKDAFLTSVGHKRPSMAIGMPLDSAIAKASVIATKIRYLNN